MKHASLLRPVVTLALALVGSAAFAQQQQSQPASTNIRRNTGTISNVGDFPTETPPPPPRPTNGNVGSTGSVTEHGPDAQLRGSVGPAPGEIDMNHPIGPGDVARIVRAYEPRFRPCYDRARSTHRTLAGRVAMRFTVARDGSLNNVEVTGLPEAPEVAPCIRTELATLHFPRPESGVLPFAYGMNFNPPAPPVRGGRRAPPPPAHPAHPAHPAGGR